MIVSRIHDRLMLGGTLLVVLGVVAARLLEGGWADGGLAAAVAGAILLVAGIVKKTAAGR